MLTEKASYLKGLMEGLEIDSSTKEGKVLLAMKDVIEEICETVDSIDEDVDQICDFCERMDEDLCNLENCCENCDECDCSDDDSEYEVVCPECGATIQLTEPMLEDGSVKCPDCGEILEFDIDEEEDDDQEQ